MRWTRAWIVMRKDLDEFKKQKLVVGSIIMMPLVLGVVLPLVMFVPMINMTPTTDVWDVPQLIITGYLSDDFIQPSTNRTLENVSMNTSVLTNADLINAQLTDVTLSSCIIENTTISHATIQKSILNNTYLNNVVITESEGKNLDGQNIVSINSSLSFTKIKPSELQLVLPLMLNMVLMIFIIVPATLPTIIATYSIVGEKNNRSLEPLLATPTTDGEILTGKVLSAFLPTMAATLFSFCVGVSILDYIFLSRFGYIPLNTTTWVLAMLVLAPTTCFMSILACVIVSSKVSDVRAAQQIGGFVVMPVVVLMLGVLSGFILLSPLTIVLAATAYGCIDLGLFYFARAIFNRENILTNWK